MVYMNYDQAWENRWDDMKEYGPFSRHLRRIIKLLISPLEVQSVLDVGCGQGSLLKELSEEYPHIRLHGADISTKAIELASNRVPGARFWQLDIEEDSLDERFDLILCGEVLEHVANDTLAIENLSCMMDKYLIVSSPQGRMREFEANVGHVRNYDYGELPQKLESAGLTILNVIQWGFPFYSPLYRDLINITGSQIAMGSYGLVRKLVANLIYYVFILNSSKKGDEVVILAQIDE
jgi:SAM-dependent methyltransferase